MLRMTPAPPATMAALPRGRGGLPVPYVAAWSSERWAAIRYEPLVNHVAVYTAGRHGRGRPVFGAMNEPRQRECVILSRCGVCRSDLEPAGRWLPNHGRLVEAWAEFGGVRHDMTTEPPCCQPCATWAALACPGIAGRTDSLLRLTEIRAVAQYVDPSAGPGRHDSRFDGEDDPADRDRLGRIARQHGGAVGYVKVAIIVSEIVPLIAARAHRGAAS